VTERKREREREKKNEHQLKYLLQEIYSSVSIEEKKREKKAIKICNIGYGQSNEEESEINLGNQFY
jgi:hypothetical protein